LLATLTPTPTDSVGVGSMFGSVCLYVCLSVCSQHNSKTNDPKVFKLGIGNDFGMSYKFYGFGLERSKVKVRIMVRVRVRVNINTAWVRTL